MNAIVPGRTVQSFTAPERVAFTIRTMREEDAADAHRFINGIIAEDACILVNAPVTPEEEREFVREALTGMENGTRAVFVVEADGVFSGVFEVRRQPYRKSHIGVIGITLARGIRDIGIGGKCIDVLIGTAKDMGLRMLCLHAFENNGRALHLYEKKGFRASGTTPGTYAYKGGFVGEVMMYLELA